MSKRAKVTWNSVKATTVVDGFSLMIERGPNGAFQWRVWKMAAGPWEMDRISKEGEASGERLAKSAALRAVRKIQSQKIAPPVVTGDGRTSAFMEDEDQ